MRRYKLKARGIDIDCIAARVASLLNMAEEDAWRKGRYGHIVTARSLICFLAVRLDMSMPEPAQRFGISTAAVNKSVKRGHPKGWSIPRPICILIASFLF